MTNPFILPGEVASDLLGLEKESDHRQIFRMFVNTMAWSAVGISVVVIALTV